MAAEIISGTVVAEQIRAELKVKVQELLKKGIHPGVVFVRVGEDPASVSYVTGKGKAAEELGILSETIVLPVDTPEQKLLDLVHKLNKEPSSMASWFSSPCPNKSMRTRY